MANYSVKLHPDLVNMSTEGSMDTSVLEGKSLQRTFHGLMLVNGSDRKMVGRLMDGDQFDDVVETDSPIPTPTPTASPTPTPTPTATPTPTPTL